MADNKPKSAPVFPFGAVFATLLGISLGLSFIAAPALAADPIYPTGSRVGLVPPAGMVKSDKFDGFADPSQEAAILINILPAAAYAQIEKTVDTEAAKKQGVHLEKREPITLDIGKGVLLSGWQMAEGSRFRKYLLLLAADDLTVLVTVQVPDQDATYPDSVVRAALATLALRAKVPESEELTLLPFEVGDLAGFRIDGVLRGRALMLSDAASSSNDGGKDSADTTTRAHFLIAAVPGGPSDPADRGNFAKLSFDEIGGIRNVHLTMSEPLRVGGQSGYQTMADAQDARSGANLKVVQWLRFGGGGFLQMIGIAPADSWTTVLARLRTVRDSVELK
jgi:hypothetical protein